MIIDLYDGNEFELDKIDMVVELCRSIEANHSIVLTDSRGITNNKHIEQVVELFVDLKPSLLVVINDKDIKNLTEFMPIIEGWMSTHKDIIKIGICVSTHEEVDNYKSLFSVPDTEKIMFIVKVSNNNPPIKEVLDTIIKNNLYRVLCIDQDHTISLDYKEIGNLIALVTEDRRKYNVALQLGCGFPLCMFSKEQLGDIFCSPISSFYFFCVPKTIIKPDLTIKYCNLTNYKINMIDINNIMDAYISLSELKIKNEEVITKCAEKNCWSYGRNCSGGCVIHNSNL